MKEEIKKTVDKEIKGTHKMIKSGQQYWKELVEIQAKRTVGVDKGRPLKFERLTDAITKARFWPEVKKEVIDMPRKEDTI